MFDVRRIKEANVNIGSYMQDGLLKKFQFDKNIFKILLANAKESLLEAENVKSPLWRVVISYYAMYYYANAVLLKLGYKVGNRISHKVTSDALIVFVRNKLSKEYFDMYESSKEQALATMKSDEIISSFDLERKKRSKFQYSTSEKFKVTMAETSLNRAKKFSLAMMDMIVAL
jgi:hypothetical protein